MNEREGLGVCPRCDGQGVIGEAGAAVCPLCGGMGMIGDSGPAPPPESLGILAFAACGCAKDWIGEGASDQARAKRLELWGAEGRCWEATDWGTARVKLTEGAACTHDPRATPREIPGAPDLGDLPATPAPTHRRIVSVELGECSEDAEFGDGGIVNVVLICTLEDGNVRHFTVFLDSSPTTGPEGA